MNYRYELVDPETGVIRRWEIEHPNDEQALTALEGADLLEDEHAQLFRADEPGPFATRAIAFGVEMLA